MATLLKRWRRVHLDAEGHEPEIEVAGSPAEPNTLLLFIAEGGLSFRLLPFTAIEPARAYIHNHAPVSWRSGTVAFWALHTESVPERLATSVQPVEAAVIVRTPGRPSVVQLYSFVNMETAQSFLRDWLASGLDPGLVLLYWAAPVSLEEPSPTLTDATPAEPDLAGVPPHLALPPAQPVADSEVQSRQPPRSHGRVRRAAKGLSGPGEAPAGTPDKPGQDAGETNESGRSSITRSLAQIAAWQAWDGLAPRMVAAALLDREVYEDVRRDQQATGRAAIIVTLGALAAGIGAVNGGLASVLWHALAALPAWTAYAGGVYLVGTRMLGARQVPLVRLLQAAGLAGSPALLLVLGAVPVYGPLFILGVQLWVLVAMGRAAEPALELDKESALLASAIGWVPFFAISQLAPMILS